MIWFAIRQKSTGWFMPTIPGRTGGTWLEPSATEPPRLFAKKQYAGYALKHWLEGKKTRNYDYETGDQIGEAVTKVPSRNPDDMEIVQVQLTVI